MLLRFTSAGLLAAVVATAGCSTHSALANCTESLGMRVLPTPGKVTTDGKSDDWDLSGGIFVCGNVRTFRDQYACWFHMMYDADNLYLLTRWIDQTPMNNPAYAGSSEGFNGDCLQVRFMMAPDTRRERTCHVTAWTSSKDKKDVVTIDYGRGFKEGKMPDAQKEGAHQAFLKNADGKGYGQEISLPWKLLTKGGKPLRAGDKFIMTLEPNFCYGWRSRQRYTTKDIFRPGVRIDRFMTFKAFECWGAAVLEAEGNVKPWPVRVTNGRLYGVSMKGKIPVVDWDGREQPPPDQFVGVTPPAQIKAVRRLTVVSDPLHGVKITGDKTAVTNTAILCDENEEVNLVAPLQAAADGKHYKFRCWYLDNVEQAYNVREIHIRMDIVHHARALYIIQDHQLRVESEPITGVTITGDNRGVTDYMTLCVSGQIVNLGASPTTTAAGKKYNFVRWAVDGADRPQGLVNVRLTMNADLTAKAMYELSTPPPTVKWDDDEQPVGDGNDDQPTEVSAGKNAPAPQQAPPVGRSVPLRAWASLILALLLGFFLIWRLFLARRKS